MSKTLIIKSTLIYYKLHYIILYQKNYFIIILSQP